MAHCPNVTEGSQCCIWGFCTDSFRGRSLLYCMWSLCGELYLKFSEKNRIKISNLPEFWQKPRIKTGLPFPDGNGVGRTREKQIDYLPLYWWVGSTVLLLRQQLQILQNETLTLLHFMFYVHWTINWTQYYTLSKQGQEKVGPVWLLSHFSTWKGLSEGCAHYWRKGSHYSPLFERPSKCSPLLATVWGTEGESGTKKTLSLLQGLGVLETSGKLLLEISWRLRACM